ncbi:MAG: phage baseplate assembly protein [Firmicutes bacterium]|nr:phage baseplate assembly protein [Bacillota bacterium]
MDINSVFGNRKGSGKDEAFQNMLRYGKVSSVNSKLHTVRVAFADKGGVVSHSLPVLIRGSLKNKHYHLPDVDEDVLCVFLPNGIQRGFVLGSFYNVNNSPPVASADKEHVTFSDGTIVEYDRSSSTMTVDCIGTINITAANGVTIAGNVTVTGSIAASGDVTAGNISLEAHVHSGVASGGSTTGEPE